LAHRFASSGENPSLLVEFVWRQGHDVRNCGGEQREDQRMMYGYNGLWGLLVLAGDIWAVINIFQSSASNEKKLLWTLIVVLLPVLGLILWFFLGPRGGKT
jgi:hypothetical protein